MWSLFAPLKTRSSAALAECAHLVKDRCIALNGVVVAGTVGVAPALDMETPTEWCVVSLGDVISVGVVDLSVLLGGLDFPFWVNLGIFQPCSLVLVGAERAVPATGLVWVAELSLPGDHRVGETCVEGAVLNDVLVDGGEVERLGGELALLAFLKIILDAEVDDVENFGGEKGVLAGEFDVGGDVGLDVGLECPELGDEKTEGPKNDGKDVDAVVEVVLQLVDGDWDIHLLFGEATYVVAVNPPPAVGGLEG